MHKTLILNGLEVGEAYSGALFPAIMGLIADKYGMSAGFLTPVPLFIFIAYYAISGYKVRR